MNKRIIILILFSIFALLSDAKPVIANYELTINLPENLDSFPIRTPQLGSTAIECYPDTNKSGEWVLHQGKNEYSLCLDPDNHPFDNECAGADFAKETWTTRACYYKNQKRLHLVTNTQNFSDYGCSANSGAKGASPGGYGLTLLSVSSERDGWFTTGDYTLANLDKLVISTDLKVNYYDYNHTTNGCPAGLSDPVAGRDPISFINMDVMSNLVDSSSQWLGSQYYTVGLFDNRDFMMNPQLEIKDCQLPDAAAGSVVNTGQPITFFGGERALYDGKTRHYEVDVLPRIKYYIQSCLGVSTDFNRVKLSGFFFHNESYNTTILSYDLIDPKVKLVYKTGYNPTPSIPTPTPSSTPSPTWTPTPTSSPIPTMTPLPPSVTPTPVNFPDFLNLFRTYYNQPDPPSSVDLNNDGKVDIFDYNMFMSH